MEAMRDKRRPLICVLVAMVATSTLPCLRHAGENAAEWARANAWREEYRLPASPAPPASCDNEFGCFCRGATLVGEQSVLAIARDAEAVSWLNAPFQTRPPAHALLGDPDGPLCRIRAGCLTGRALRILSASLLI